MTPYVTLVVDCRLKGYVYTGSDLRHVAVMATVGPFADLHVTSVADADRLPVSEREATPRRKSAYFDVSVSLQHCRATGSGLRGVAIVA